MVAARSAAAHTFETRLGLAFMAVVALSLLAVSLIVVYRLDGYFRDQEQTDLEARAFEVASVVAFYVVPTAGDLPVVEAGNTLNPTVARALADPDYLRFLADRVARADVDIRIGNATQASSGVMIVTAAPRGIFTQDLQAPPENGQAREALAATDAFGPVSGGALGEPWGVSVMLSNPYTTRASTLATIGGLIALGALGALMAALIVSTYLASRFTRPLRRLGEATHRLGAGDLKGRVPMAELESSYSEVADLARQFNAMADRLEESMDLVRRDRDRSRDFLADVSHELRTPLAALRMNIELLQGRAGEDPVARAEFLETSRIQLDRMDWLAHNLLELSKLESGLLRLDLRPEDLRATVESAVEQAAPGADRRGISLQLQLPDAPVRTLHDPQRIGQVVGNLVGNAVKFTPRGGSVIVELASHRDGARLEVRDTGVGIDATEIPHIFERFYRGSRASEARGSGSGLGLSIVKSIVDMHDGRITVESRVGVGTSIVVVLPRNPRRGEDRPGERVGEREGAGIITSPPEQPPETPPT